MTSNARPTDEAIDLEIQKLKEMKQKVRETSAFGDNNRDAIDAQIVVLEGRMMEDEIYERFGEEADGFAQNVLDSALDALEYLDGNAAGDEIPSSSWASLVQA